MFIVLLGSSQRQAIGRYPTNTLAQVRDKAKIIPTERALGKLRPGNISWKKALEEYLEAVEAKIRPRTYDQYSRP